MGLFKSLISEIREANKAQYDKEDKLWSLIENMDLSNKRVEYSIWNDFFGAKQYKIISPSGDYIIIKSPEPRLIVCYYSISYYKNISNYYPTHEFVCNIDTSGLLGLSREVIVNRLVQDLERRKHLSGTNAMDRF